MFQILLILKMSLDQATRLSKIKSSPTLSASTKAKELKAKGFDIIDLTVGEPDFNTPKHILDAAKLSMDQGKTKYTAVDGTPSLKEAIKNKLQRENGLNYDLNQISVGCGAKHVIFNVLMASVNKDDEVIIPAPYWVSYPDMVLLCDGKPVFVECDEQEGFKLTPEKLRNSITSKTKWLILNSPSNPTGAVYSKEELKGLSDVLLEFPHVNIISDDIYEHLIYDSKKFFNILNVEPKLYERTTLINGGSKSFSMTGLRIGYAASGNPFLIKEMSKIQSHSTSNPCSTSQYALEAGLNSDISFLNEWKKIYQQRRNLALETLNQSPYFEIKKENCSGAFYLFVNCEKLIGKIGTLPDGKKIEFISDAEICEYFLFKANVSVVLGSAFGLSPYFRMSYALNDEVLLKACKRILKSLDNLE